jgi:trk system potassium uptake protein TrkH
VAGGFDLSAPQLLLGSFAGLIAFGTAGFLLLPGLWVGPRAGFVDALFTATSAVCVTGLTVIDVSTRLTAAGQAWLLALIQLGGLGILTIAALAAGTLGRRLSLEVEEATAGPAALLPLGGWRALVRSVVTATFAIECAGAVALWVAWRGDLGAAGAIWPAVFSAISAFCNAGFSVFAHSLEGYADDLPTLAVVGALIVLGGIGFLVLEDLRARLLRRRRRLTLHSRIVLGTTALLLAVATPLYLLFEWDHVLAPHAGAARVANALFMAITPRTAGFDTVDYGAITNPSVVLTLALMWVGGAPGSTAGGVKVTTAALLGLLLVSRLRGREHVSIANRTLPEATVQRAVGLAVGAILLLFAFVFLLLWVELPHGGAATERERFVHLVFEAQSALGTVGLSMGATGTLSPAGRILIVALMFLGRVGPLAALEAMARRSRRRQQYRYAHEDVLVG